MAQIVIEGRRGHNARCHGRGVAHCRLLHGAGLGLVVSVVQVQTNPKHRTALFLCIDGGGFESIA